MTVIDALSLPRWLVDLLTSNYPPFIQITYVISGFASARLFKNPVYLAADQKHEKHTSSWMKVEMSSEAKAAHNDSDIIT